jgi:hypothetical protein
VRNGCPVRAPTKNTLETYPVTRVAEDELRWVVALPHEP